MEELSLEVKIAKKINELRTEKELSMRQLGELCGITAQRIYELEIGKKIPRLNTLVKIADGLGVSVFDILDEPLGRHTKSCANSATCPYFKPGRE
jgi:transcriptional regulator with XRE-family HTH domain